jgi:hypothetical protein
MIPDGKFGKINLVWIVLVGVALLLMATVTASMPAHGNEMATFAKWSKVELEFNGPSSLGMGEPNPFQIHMDVAFSGPGSQVYTIPAFYDGDGVGGLDGNVWKARFSPDEAGTWTYLTSSGEGSLDGSSGSFQVTDNPGCNSLLSNGLPDFTCTGRLEYIGEHYLQFSNGDYWLKGGANEPEDFLVPGVNAGFSSKQAAVDYLANKGINSIYLMLDNIDGDRKNIWPWVGETQAEAKLNHERFDVAKLAGWEDMFEMIQQRGLVLHIVFEDDSAWTGFNREMYYREVMARFGHINGLYWNLAEEYNEVYSANQIKGYAQILSDLDAYGHPLTVHQQGGLTNWEPFIDDSRFDLTSFQTDSEPQNPAAVEWFDNVEDSGRTIPVAFDESTRRLESSERDKFRHVAWSIYAGGANYEAYTRMGSAGYLEYEQIFADIGRAKNFLGGLQFWNMRPENDLLTSGVGYVFAELGETYLVYLPGGGSISLDLRAGDNKFEASWFNPRDGSIVEIGQVLGSGEEGFEAPDANDWALLLVVDHSTPPVIISNPETEAMQGEIYHYQVQASGEPAPFFSLLESPPGLAINSGSGLIEWLPSNSGKFQVEVKAENVAGNDTQMYTIDVSPIPVQEDIGYFFPLISR